MQLEHQKGWHEWHALALRGHQETDPDKLGDIFEQLLEALDRCSSRDQPPDKTTTRLTGQANEGRMLRVGL